MKPRTLNTQAPNRPKPLKSLQSLKSLKPLKPLKPLEPLSPKPLKPLNPKSLKPLNPTPLKLLNALHRHAKQAPGCLDMYKNFTGVRSYDEAEALVLAGGLGFGV